MNEAWKDLFIMTLTFVLATGAWTKAFIFFRKMKVMTNLATISSVVALILCSSAMMVTIGFMITMKLDPLASKYLNHIIPWSLFAVGVIAMSLAIIAIDPMKKSSQKNSNSTKPD